MNLGAPKTFLQPLIVLLLTVDFRVYDSQIKSISFLILKSLCVLLSLLLLCDHAKMLKACDIYSCRVHTVLSRCLFSMLNESIFGFDKAYFS